MDELRAKLLHEIIGIYGPGKGMSIASVIVPAFIGDFQKVVGNSSSFDEVSEEYMTEDKKIHLELYGRKLMGKGVNNFAITRCVFNGKVIVND